MPLAPPGLRVFNLSGLAVIPEERNNGYGWLLTVKMLQLARSAGYQLAICSAWRESSAPSAPVLQRAGLKQVAVITNFWLEDRRGYRQCPRCGQRCYCSAELFAGIL